MVSLYTVVAVILTCQCVTADVTYTDCKEDTVETPQVIHVGYKSEMFASVEVCGEACARSNFDACAIDENSNCFCGDHATLSALGSATCDLNCGDGNPCGVADTPGSIALYEVTKEVTALTVWVDPTLSLTEPYVIEVATTFKLVVGNTTDYIVDWGDGSQSGGSGTENAEHDYHVAGTFDIIVFMVAKPDVQSVLQVTVVPEPIFELTCPTMFELDVPDKCIVTKALQGYEFTFEMTAGSDLESVTKTGSVPGAYSMVYGGSTDTSATTNVNAPGIVTAIAPAGSLFVYNPTKPIAMDGLLTRVEATLDSASADAELEVMALVPDCAAGSFCRGSCATDCTNECAGGLICSQTGRCASSCPATASSGYSLVSLTTVTVPANGGASAFIDVDPPVEVLEGTFIGFKNLAAADIMSQDGLDTAAGDRLVDSSDTTSITTSDKRYAVRFLVDHHPTVEFIPEFTCTIPAAVPVADVPTPYDVNTEVYANMSAVKFSLKIDNQFSKTITLEEEGLCQVEIPEPTLLSELWMAFGSMTEIDIVFSSGSSIVMFAMIDTDKVYNYYNDARTGYTWALPLTYPVEGTYRLTGEAFNARGKVTFDSLIHVVPNITDDWTLTATCLCLDWDGGYDLALEWPSAAHPPWNATINITSIVTLPDGGTTVVIVNPEEVLDFETYDGAAPGGASGTAKPLSWNKQITSIAGNHTVTAYLSNEISSTFTIATYEVKEAIRNITAELTWINNGNEQPGTGPEKDIYILNKTVLIYPSTRTGIPDKWRVSVNGTVIIETDNIPFTDMVFNTTFDAEADYYVTVSGWNSIQDWIDSPPIFITVVNKIANFRLEDSLQLTKPGETLVVQAVYDILTPISCLVVDWGDGSVTETYGSQARCNETHANAKYMGLLTNPYDLAHAYSNEGEYKIVALAFDEFLQLPDQLDIVVADLPCNYPNVSIVNQVFYSYSARTLFKSLMVVEEGVTQPLDCNGTIPPIERFWTVVQIDAQSLSPLGEVAVKDVYPSWNYSQLSIPKTQLDVGHYKIKYHVTLKMKYDLTRDSETYLEIIPSPLVGIIINGSMSALTRGFSQTLDLEPGLLSYDPDDISEPLTNITWFCRQISPDEGTFTFDGEGMPIDTGTALDIPGPLGALGRTGGGCFGEGNGALNLDEVNYLFEMSSFLYATGVFEISVVFRKDTRVTTTKIELTITPKPPPEVKIECGSDSLCWPFGDVKLINPALNLGLVGSCTDACGEPHTHTWEFFDVDRNPVVIENGCDISSGDGAMVVSAEPPACVAPFKTSLEGNAVILNPEFFEVNPTVEKYIIRLTIATAAGAVGFSETKIQVNKPPSSGDGTLVFNQTLSVISRYNVDCFDWIDPENLGIESYTYYYLEEQPDGSQTKAILASTRQNTLPAILPLGVHELHVEIRDVLGSYTDITLGAATAHMPTEEELAAYDPAAVMQGFTDTGDTIMLEMTIKAYNSILRNSTAAALDPAKLANMTAEEIDELLIHLANITNNQIQQILNGAAPATLSQLTSTSETLSSIVATASMTDMAAYTRNANSRVDVVAILNRMTDSMESLDVPTPQQMEPFISSSMSTMTSEMSTCNKIIRANDKAPPYDMKYSADSMDYNPALPDYEAEGKSPSDFEIPTDKDSILTQNVLENTKQICQVTTDEMLEVMDRIVLTAMKKMVKGDSISTTSDQGAEMVLTKLGEEQLEKGLKISSTKETLAAIEYFPKFCPSRQFNPYTICRTEIGFTFIVWPCVTQFYTKSASFLAESTTVIQAEVSLENGKVPVANQPNDIIIEIPRKEIVVLEAINVNVSSTILPYIPLVYHYYNITIPDAALTIQITPGGSVDGMIMLIGYMKYPLPKPEGYWKKFMISDYVNDNGTYSIFLPSNDVQNKTGKFIIGVGVLKSAGDAEELSTDSLKDEFEDYSLKITLAGCYFYNETAKLWSSKDTIVSRNSERVTTCKSNHLTGFGSGFIPTPNSVDFEFIVANLGFIDNATLYVVLILLLVLYILMMIWASYTDKKDLERLGVVPLPDNKVEDRYVYELTFYTGPDKEATCESNINIILSGDNGESEVRKLPEPSLNLYRRYDRNGFVMTTPAPLGHIHFLRIYHDNSGRPPYDSWQVERVVVRDLQERHTYNFEINAWLAFSRDEGLIDRVFSCTDNTDDDIEFSSKMYSRVNRSANQDHMWLGIFLRPAGSRYSRKERVTVAFVFLYLSMICNAMYYQSSEETEVDALFSIGIIPITATLVMTGFLVLIFVYPICLLITMVFKRARPKELKRCRALDAIEDQKYEELEEKNNISKLEEYNVKYAEDDEEKPKEVPVVKCLPWWTRTVAWIICFVAMAASIFFVFTYGIQWGNIKTIKWFSSFFTSFFISLIVSQWIKVVVFALCGSVFSSVSLGIDDVDCDEELPSLKKDEQWNYETEVDSLNIRKVHKVEGVDPNCKKHKRLRNQLKKEREMKSVARGVVMYCFFLAILLVIVYERLDSNNFLMKRHLENTFIKPGHLVFDVQSKMVTKDDFWSWCHNVLVDELLVGKHYNGDQPLGLRGFLDDKTNRIIGYAIIRQTRVHRFSCEMLHPMELAIKECTGGRGMDKEDNRNYCSAWKSAPTFPGSCLIEEFKYRDSTLLKTLPYWGNLGYYGAGGYVVRLKGAGSTIKKKFTALQQQQWIDKRTRIVMVEFSVYNANVNLFTLCTITAEFIEGGGIVTKWGFQPVKLLTVGTSLGNQIGNLCKIFFCIATAIFTVKELWKMKNEKCSYFSSYWNMTELILLLVSYTAIGLFFYKTYLTEEAIKLFNVTQGNAYVRMDPAINIDNYYVFLLGFIMFFSILKLIKLLQFNKRMNLLALTIGKCWDELQYFFIAFGVVFFAFVALFYFMFKRQIIDFSHVMGSVLMCISMMLGKFEFQAMKEANELSPILFFVFSVINSTILINIMLTIILQAFNEIKTDLSKKANKYDLLDFMWKSFRKNIKMQPDAINQVKTKTTDKKIITGWEDLENEPENLPDKVDDLMSYISKSFFGGKLDAKNNKAMKEALLKRQQQNDFRTTHKTIMTGDD